MEYTKYDMNAVLLRGDVHAVDRSHHQLLPMKEFPRFWVRRLVDRNLKSAAPLNWFPGPLEVHFWQMDHLDGFCCRCGTIVGVFQIACAPSPLGRRFDSSVAFGRTRTHLQEGARRHRP